MMSIISIADILLLLFLIYLLITVDIVISALCFQHVYRASFLSENMIYDIVRTLKFEHVELVKNAASAVFQVGSSQSSRMR